MSCGVAEKTDIKAGGVVVNISVYHYCSIYLHFVCRKK